MIKGENKKKPDSLSSENTDSSDDFLLYPNPASSNIWVEFYSNSNTVIVISNLLEQIVQEVPVNETGKVQVSINIQHLKKGIYFVSLRGINYKPKVMIKL